MFVGEWEQSGHYGYAHTFYEDGTWASSINGLALWQTGFWDIKRGVLVIECNRVYVGGENTYSFDHTYTPKFEFADVDTLSFYWDNAAIARAGLFEYQEAGTFRFHKIP
jgi:hypothetical protein